MPMLLAVGYAIFLAAALSKATVASLTALNDVFIKAPEPLEHKFRALFRSDIDPYAWIDLHFYPVFLNLTVDSTRFEVYDCFLKASDNFSATPVATSAKLIKDCPADKFFCPNSELHAAYGNALARAALVLKCSVVYANPPHNIAMKELQTLALDILPLLLKYHWRINSWILGEAKEEMSERSMDLRVKRVDMVFHDYRFLVYTLYHRLPKQVRPFLVRWVLIPHLHAASNAFVLKDPKKPLNHCKLARNIVLPSTLPSWKRIAGCGRWERSAPASPKGIDMLVSISSSFQQQCSDAKSFQERLELQSAYVRTVLKCPHDRPLVFHFSGLLVCIPDVFETVMAPESHFQHRSNQVPYVLWLQHQYDYLKSFARRVESAALVDAYWLSLSCRIQSFLPECTLKPLQDLLNGLLDAPIKARESLDVKVAGYGGFYYELHVIDGNQRLLSVTPMTFCGGSDLAINQIVTLACQAIALQHFLKCHQYKEARTADLSAALRHLIDQYGLKDVPLIHRYCQVLELWAKAKCHVATADFSPLPIDVSDFDVKKELPINLYIQRELAWYDIHRHRNAAWAHDQWAFLQALLNFYSIGVQSVYDWTAVTV